MRILLLIGSSKICGNTEQLANAFTRGAAEQGHQVTQIHLGKVTVNPCLGCNACADNRECVQKDGMKEVISAFLSCDLVVFATPLYFWGISAQLKAVIDRLYVLREKDSNGYFRYPPKKCILMATSADSDRHFWTFELVEAYYRRLVRYFHWTDLGILTAGSCGGTIEPRRIAETKHLEKAYAFGKGI